MPKATIIFLAYNQAPYVAEALRSALNQDYPDFEVVISDDCSTDGTRALIEEEVRKHPQGGRCRLLPARPNMGIVRSWERAVAASSGEILFGFAGDDISDSSRVSLGVAVFDRDRRAMAWFCQAKIIGQSGETLKESFLRGRPTEAVYVRSDEDTFFEFWGGAPVLGASGAYRRKLAESFGPIIHGSSEDDPYVYRALLLGGVAYSPQALVSWRWHGDNASMGALLAESNRTKALESRAAIFLRRRRGCLQHLRDLAWAYRSGLIQESRLRHERRLIAVMREAEMVRHLAISPSASVMALLGSCCRFLAGCRWSRRAFIFTLSSCKTRISSTETKLKKSRPL